MQALVAADVVVFCLYETVVLPLARWILCTYRIGGVA